MIVLDSSTLLASLLAEQGNDRVDALLATQPCGLSTINRSEVHARLLTSGRSNLRARAIIDSLELIELPVDRSTAELAAILRASTQKLGLGIADRVCIATGMLHDAVIITADRSWSKVDLPDADIQVVR